MYSHHCSELFESQGSALGLARAGTPRLPEHSFSWKSSLMASSQSSSRVGIRPAAGALILLVAALLASPALSQTASLSFGAPATQSSTSDSLDAGRAVDGAYGGFYKNRALSSTLNEASPWWQVDLGAIYDLEEMLIWNRREDCCRDRLRDFYVLVSGCSIRERRPRYRSGAARSELSVLRGPDRRTSRNHGARVPSRDGALHSNSATRREHSGNWSRSRSMAQALLPGRYRPSPSTPPAIR